MSATPRAQPVGLGDKARAVHVFDQVYPLDRQCRLICQRIEQSLLVRCARLAGSDRHG
jgi:hypothetical protein